MKNEKVGVWNLQRVLEEHDALRDLNALAEAGCDADNLRSLLELAPIERSWKRSIGMDLLHLKQVIAEIKHCSQIIERLNRSELYYHVSIEISDPSFHQDRGFDRLPKQLLEYVDALEYLRKSFGLKKEPRIHAWKAFIVATVIEDSKTPHDRSVATLVGAVLGKPQYSEKAHQNWRLKSNDLVELMRQKIRQRRARWKK